MRDPADQILRLFFWKFLMQDMGKFIPQSNVSDCNKRIIQWRNTVIYRFFTDLYKLEKIKNREILLFECEMHIIEFVCSSKSINSRKRKLFSAIKTSLHFDSLIWNSDNHCLNIILSHAGKVTNLLVASLSLQMSECSEAKSAKLFFRALSFATLSCVYEKWSHKLIG